MQYFCGELQMFIVNAAASIMLSCVNIYCIYSICRIIILYMKLTIVLYKNVNVIRLSAKSNTLNVEDVMKVCLDW